MSHTCVIVCLLDMDRVVMYELATLTHPVYSVMLVE